MMVDTMHVLNDQLCKLMTWVKYLRMSCLVREGLCLCNLPPTTRNPPSILGSRDLILLRLRTCWPFSRHLISSPKYSTYGLFTSWSWAALNSVAVSNPVWRSSFFIIVLFTNRITYASTLLGLAGDQHLFLPNTGSVSWETPTHLILFLSHLSSSRATSTLLSGHNSATQCKGTPAQRCSDASRLVLQGGVPRYYHLLKYRLSARTYLQLTVPASSTVSTLLVIVWISDIWLPTNAL